MKKMSAEEIIQFIGDSEKSTPVKVYVKGDLKKFTLPEEGVQVFFEEKTGILFGEWTQIKGLLDVNKEIIEDYVVENDRRNSAIPLLDMKAVNARIEPGAVIRDQVEIGDNAVIMMGALVNIGASIGARTMIDMGAVLGGRAEVGEGCHIGAGAVLAGVIEPPSATPVIIEDNVLIGANAIILEGVRVGAGAVVAAGAVVIDDVASDTVVAGVPARVIKNVADIAKGKIEIKDELRKL